MNRKQKVTTTRQKGKETDQPPKRKRGQRNKNKKNLDCEITGNIKRRKELRIDNTRKEI